LVTAVKKPGRLRATHHEEANRGVEEEEGAGAEREGGTVNEAS